MAGDGVAPMMRRVKRYVRRLDGVGSCSHTTTEQNKFPRARLSRLWSYRRPGSVAQPSIGIFPKYIYACTPPMLSHNAISIDLCCH